MDAMTVAIGLAALILGATLGYLLQQRRMGEAQFAREHARATEREELIRSHTQQCSERDAIWAAERTEMHGELAAARASLEAERAAATDREALLARTEAQLRETFSSLSAEALAKNNEAMLTLTAARLETAKAKADGDLAQRQQAIDAMVAPMRDTLDKVAHQLTTVEKERAASYAALREQVGSMAQTSEQLRTETAQLVTALRAPQVRGRWGELQLERTVEAAGLSEHVDYHTQAISEGEDGRLIPDMVVHLVGGKNIVIDSKVAFAGYLEAMEANDESTRSARLKAHARHLRTHIDALAAKAYWERFTPAPEFVVCFVPADAFLEAALREDPTLQEHAFERNVVLATPSTLVALLRTVAYTWRQDALARNAAEVHELGRELYKRLSTMGGHVDKLGRSLRGAVDSYNKTVTSLESRVFVTARRLTELQVETTDSLTPMEQITTTTRSAEAPELVAQRVVPISAKLTQEPQLPLAGLAQGSPEVDRGTLLEGELDPEMATLARRDTARREAASSGLSGDSTSATGA